MAREKKNAPLRPVHTEIEGLPPIRLEIPLTSSKDERELQSRGPVTGASLEPVITAPELLEQNWGQPTAHRHVPWGWFVLIGAAVAAAIVWSLTRVTQADAHADQIRNTTTSSLVKKQLDEQQATTLINRINQTIRDFYSAASVEERARWVRQPERVIPLMRQYYAHQPPISEALRSAPTLQPFTFDNRGNFWRATVTLTNRRIDHLILEIQDSGDVRIDWESLVCYQPMSWDDYAAQRPTGKSLDFRVLIEPDHFFSHEFSDSQKWVCFRLTTLNNIEPLFGYAPADSQEGRELLNLFTERRRQPATVILRLAIPEGLQSRRGVVIQKILSRHWIYITPPDSSP